MFFLSDSSFALRHYHYHSAAQYITSIRCHIADNPNSLCAPQQHENIKIFALHFVSPPHRIFRLFHREYCIFSILCTIFFLHDQFVISYSLLHILYTSITVLVVSTRFYEYYLIIARNFIRF